MGGSAGDRHGAQNPTMQARNGVCDKIENYISDLARWYVSNRVVAAALSAHSSQAVCFPPCVPTVGTVGSGGRGWTTRA